MKAKKYLIFTVVYAACFLIALGYAIGRSPVSFWDTVKQSDTSFGERLETYLASHLPFHETIKGSKVTLELLSGTEEINGLFYENNSLLESLVVEDSTISLQNQNNIYSYVLTHYGQTTVALVPSSVWVNQKEIPASAPLFDEGTYLSNLALLLGEEHTLNMTETFMEQQGGRLFYRTDSMPTQLAGYLLYSGLGNYLGYKPLSLSSYIVTPLLYNCYGDLYPRWSNRGVRGDTIFSYVSSESLPVKVVHESSKGSIVTYYSLTPKEAIIGGNQMDIILGGLHSRIEVTTYGAPSGSLIVIGDSSALPLISFLSPEYHTITFYDATDPAFSLENVPVDPNQDILMIFSTRSLITQSIHS